MAGRNETTAISAIPNLPNASPAEFLEYLQRGGEIRHLRSLLRSKDTDLLEKGTWIASQLGSRLAKQVLDAVLPHLQSSSWLIRYQSLECVLDFWKTLKPSTVGTVLGLVEDPDQSVRRKILTMLGSFRPSQITHAKRHVKSPRLREHLGWLARADSRKTDQVLAWVRSVEPLKRRIGVAAALRGDGPELLEKVAQELHDEQLIPIVEAEVGVRKYMAKLRKQRRMRAHQ